MKARVWLKAPVTFHSIVRSDALTFEPGKILECSFEDCLGTMLSKFYYPAEPAPGKPAYQVPADAIERVEVEEEVARGWEKLAEERAKQEAICDAETLEGLFGDAPEEEHDEIWTLRWVGVGSAHGLFLTWEEDFFDGVLWTSELAKIRWLSREAALNMRTRSWGDDGERVVLVQGCSNCGQLVTPLKCSGRTANYRGESFPVPDDFEIPTCVGCGLEWESAEMSVKLDALFEPLWRERHATPRLTDEIIQAVRDDPSSQEALAIVDEYATNGTSHTLKTLDAISAAELAEAYARGGR